MANSITQDLIEKIGLLDAEYRQLSSLDYNLLVERAVLRNELARHSINQNEKKFFLSEAIGLLEMGLVEQPDNFEQKLLVKVTTSLAMVYLHLYEVERNPALLKIADQLLRPLLAQNSDEILWLMAISTGYQNKSALTQHWLKKINALNFIESWHTHAAFKNFREEQWFKSLVNETGVLKYS